MRMISIRKNQAFFDEKKNLIQPFQPFDCSTSFAKTMGARNPHLMAVEDFVSTVSHRPAGEIRQMAKNAGMDHTLPEKELRASMLALATAEPEGEKKLEVEPKPGDGSDFLDMNMIELRKMASELSIPNYGSLRKADLVQSIIDELEGGDEDQG